MSNAMDAESKELLREWLVRSLEPVCDADPEVLSKYVLALIQNDPKKDGLRDTCVAKLDEFLGDETVPFVGRLFTALETEAYRKDSRSVVSHHEDGGRHSGGGGGRSGAEEEDRHAHHHDGSRRRARGASDDEGSEEHARYGKQRRREDGDSGRQVSPRRGGDRDRGGDDRRHRGDAYGGRDGGRSGGRGGGGRDWDRERGGGAYPPPGDRRRNFPPEWGMPPPGMWPPHHAYPPPRGGGAAAGGAYPPHHHPMGEFDPSAYNPENPGMMPHPMSMMMGGRGGYYPPYGGRGGGRGGRSGGGYHGGRGGPPGGPSPRGEDGAPAETVAKTTLRVSNVDPKYVNMTKLSLHFSKFGNVVNVQMRPQHKCAYVQYATEDEAKKAFHSPMPVCNNRFIEVKWARFDPKDPHGAPSSKDESGEKKADAPDGDDAASKSPTTTETTGDASDGANGQAATSPSEPDAERNMTPEELRAAALEKGRRVLEEKRELLEKQKQLMKQKEELLKRQLAQQKELLERMSQNPTAVSAADKRELLNKITALSEELKALQPQPQNKLSGLKAELSALEEAAASSSAGGPFAGGRGRGRGGAAAAAVGGRWGAQQAGGRGFYGRGPGGRGGRGAGRGFSNTLDNRTTIVKVENLPEEARDASVLEQHFGNFGGIERVVLDGVDRGFIKFQDRYAGQNALTRGGMFGQARLQLSWAEAQDAPAELAPSTPAASASGDQGDADFSNESSEVSASA